jgi:hypothetical protein
MTKLPEVAPRVATRVATIPFYIGNDGTEVHELLPQGRVEAGIGSGEDEVRISVRQALTCWLGVYANCYPTYEVRFASEVNVRRVGDGQFEVQNLKLVLCRRDGLELCDDDKRVFKAAASELCDYLCAWFMTRPEERGAIELLNCESFLS